MHETNWNLYLGQIVLQNSTILGKRAGGQEPIHRNTYFLQFSFLLPVLVNQMTTGGIISTSCTRHPV